MITIQKINFILIFGLSNTCCSKIAKPKEPKTIKATEPNTYIRINTELVYIPIKPKITAKAFM